MRHGSLWTAPRVGGTLVLVLLRCLLFGVWCLFVCLLLLLLLLLCYV